MKNICCWVLRYMDTCILFANIDGHQMINLQIFLNIFFMKTFWKNYFWFYLTKSVLKYFYMNYNFFMNKIFSHENFFFILFMKTCLKKFFLMKTRRKFFFCIFFSWKNVRTVRNHDKIASLEHLKFKSFRYRASKQKIQGQNKYLIDNLLFRLAVKCITI